MRFDYVLHVTRGELEDLCALQLQDERIKLVEEIIARNTPDAVRPQEAFGRRIPATTLSLVDFAEHRRAGRSQTLSDIEAQIVEHDGPEGPGYE